MSAEAFTTFDFKAYNQAQSIKKMHAIEQFVRDGSNLSLRAYQNPFSKRIVWMVGDVDSHELSIDQVLRLTNKQERIAREGISNDCFDIAQRAVHEGISKGILKSDLEINGFVGYANHYINYQLLTNGDILAIDFTASQNIDHAQENFHVFVVQAKNMEDLLGRIKKIYGGSWELKN